MQINNYIYFSIAGFINLIFLMIIFFSRKRFDLFENKIYKVLILCTFLGIVNELIMVYFVPFLELVPIFKEIVAKLFLLITEFWIFLLALYTSTVSNNLMKKNISHMNHDKNILFLLYVICAIVTCILPIEYAYNSTMDSWLYTYGLSTKMVFVTGMLFISIILFYIIRNRNYIKFKKFIPVYTYVILSIMVSFIQQIDPMVLLISFVETLIMFIMYFTIENPDMKLLEELHRAKEISDAANEEKTIFLYNITQEIRDTTDEINDNADMILESDSLDDNKDNAREIKRITSKFKTITNEILDVSKLDSANIKVYNSKYNVKNILKEIVTIYNKKCKDKNIEFRVNIDHDVPSLLYGDSINFKEVLSIIIDNSIKYTNSGFIEFDVNTIVKNDVCRLIITIEDSGRGIKSENIDKIKLEDRSFAEVNKLITLMNGTMVISSNYGYGTKVKIILDQKIDIVIDEDIVKYNYIYDSIKLLMVDDSDSGIKIIDKLIKGSNIKMDFATNGKECIDKIKSYGRYDIILLDEQLSQISAMELIKKIKSIRNFNIPVILLTKDNGYEYNDDYKKLGFSNYLLKPVKKDELLNIINEYVKRDN